MPDISVLVTGVGGSGIGSQVLKALRLASLPLEITGTDTTRASTGVKEVDHFHLLPPAKDPSYMEAVLRIGKERNIRVLFPGSEPELLVLSKNRKALEEAGILLPVNNHEVIEVCLDKFRTNQFLAQNGFAFPQSYRVKDVSDIPAVENYPVIIKPNTGGSGSNGVMIAQNRDELMVFVSFLLNVTTDLVVQEYVGDEQSEYTVGVLSTLEGEVINSIAVHREIASGLGNRIRVKNNTGRSELGKFLVVSSGISQGRVGAFPEVTKPCEEIARKLGSAGPLNIQCRYVNGRVMVFEINPRYSGTTPLRAMAGFNEPGIMIRKYILKENIEPHFAYPEKLIMRTLKEVVIE